MAKVWTAAAADVYISAVLFSVLRKKKTGFKGWVVAHILFPRFRRVLRHDIDLIGLSINLRRT